MKTTEETIIEHVGEFWWICGKHKSEFLKAMCEYAEEYAFHFHLEQLKLEVRQELAAQLPSPSVNEEIIKKFDQWVKNRKAGYHYKDVHNSITEFLESQSKESLTDDTLLDNKEYD
jgi:hypothetical protein